MCCVHCPKAVVLHGAALDSSSAWIVGAVQGAYLKMVKVVIVIKDCVAYAYASNAGWDGREIS